MPQLELIPHSWWSWDFAVMQGNSVVAQIELSRWGWQRSGVVKVGGLHYQVSSKKRGFTLALNATQLARAEMTSWLSRSFTIQHGEKTHRLKQEWFGSSFILLDNGQQVGSLVRHGMFTRKTSVSLPDELPAPVQMFVIWLTVNQREIDAGGPDMS